MLLLLSIAPMSQNALPRPFSTPLTMMVDRGLRMRMRVGSLHIGVLLRSGHGGRGVSCQLLRTCSKYLSLEADLCKLVCSLFDSEGPP